MLVNYHKISFIKSPISAEPIQYVITLKREKSIKVTNLYLVILG